MQTFRNRGRDEWQRQHGRERGIGHGRRRRGGRGGGRRRVAAAGPGDRGRVRRRRRRPRPGCAALGRCMPACCADPDPAGDAQPARTRRGRHRHRQDQDPPAHRRTAVGQRRAGLSRRHQGRCLRHRRSRRPGRQGCRAGRAGRAAVGGQGLPVRVLRARRHRPRCSAAGDGHRLRSRTALQGAPAEPYAGAVARSDLPLRRRQGPGAGGSEGSAGRRRLSRLGHRQARTEGDRRALHGHGRGDSAVAHRLRAAGAGDFFGEPEFETAEFLRQAPDGRGWSPYWNSRLYRTGRSSSRRS